MGLNRMMMKNGNPKDVFIAYIDRTIRQFEDNALTTVGDSAFDNCSSLTSINLPNVTTVGDNAFSSCSSLTSINLPNVTTVDRYAFSSCRSLTSINLPNVTTLDNGAFSYCESLTSINLPNATTIQYSAFTDCNSLTSINLPNVTTVGDNAFTACNSLTEIHFSVKNKKAIEALSGYSNKFGATNATIYFDSMMMLPNLDGVNLFIDGEPLKDGLVVCDNAYMISANEEHSIVAIKTGAPLLHKNITPTETKFSLDLNFNVTGVTYRVIVTNTPDGKTPIIKFFCQGAMVGSATATTHSIFVAQNTVIDYRVSCNGYIPTTGRIQADVDKTISASLGDVLPTTTYDLFYPFDSAHAVLTNLVDGNNFIIAETSPTASGSTSPSPSIVSGPKSFKVSNGVSFGYIKFHTPFTDAVDLLTVSVTCQCVAEENYDVGLVYIDKQLHPVTSNKRISSTGANSELGYVMYTSYGNSQTEYKTVTKLLEPDTDYYLQFAYTKDGSGNNNWDRLSITNIKFTDAGVYYWENET